MRYTYTYRDIEDGKWVGTNKLFLTEKDALNFGKTFIEDIHSVECEQNNTQVYIKGDLIFEDDVLLRTHHSYSSNIERWVFKTIAELKTIHQGAKKFSVGEEYINALLQELKNTAATEHEKDTRVVFIKLT